MSPIKIITFHATGKYLLLLWLVIAGIAGGPVRGETADRPTDPEAVVDNFHQLLIEVMREGPELGYDGRFRKLEAVITSLFDTPLITRVILSRYWKELDEQQRSEFIDIFNHLTVATYASRFDAYNGETFAVIEREELNKGRILVRTELNRIDEDPVRMDYLMHTSNGEWQIISVIADGINDLSLKRAEYAVVIKEKGFTGLVNDLKQKIADIEAGTG